MEVEWASSQRVLASARHRVMGSTDIWIPLIFRGKTEGHVRTAAPPPPVLVLSRQVAPRQVASETARARWFGRTLRLIVVTRYIAVESFIQKAD